MEIRKTVCALLVAAAVTGCASKPKYTIADMQNPETTPVEKWSEAMVYARTMGISGLYDVPQDLAQAEAQLQSGLNSATGADLITSGVSSVSGPIGISSVTVAGVGLAMDLLGAGIGQTWQHSIIAAWVPATMASTPQEASSVVEREYSKARNRAFPLGRSSESNLPSKFPIGHPEYYGNKFPKEENSVLFEDDAKFTPGIIGEGMSYGPIYLSGKTLYLDGRRNNMRREEAAKALSAELPDWFVVYEAPRPYSKPAAPPMILRGGQSYYFVGK